VHHSCGYTKPGQSDLEVKNLRLHQPTNLKLYNTCILPILLYCSECWAVNKSREWSNWHGSESSRMFYDDWCLRSALCNKLLHLWLLPEWLNVSPTTLWTTTKDRKIRISKTMQATELLGICHVVTLRLYQLLKMPKVHNAYILRNVACIMTKVSKQVSQYAHKPEVTRRRLCIPIPLNFPWEIEVALRWVGKAFQTAGAPTWKLHWRN